MMLMMMAEEVKIAINSGGSLLKDATFGFTFAEDDFFTGGDVLRTEVIISGVWKEEQQPCLYQTARYGDLSYVFQDLPCGSYVVDLHFAEIIFTNGPPGMRVFDVSIQGQRVRNSQASQIPRSQFLTPHPLPLQSISL